MPHFFFFFILALAILHFLLHSELQEMSVAWVDLKLMKDLPAASIWKRSKKYKNTEVFCMWIEALPLQAQPVHLLSISCGALHRSLREVFSFSCCNVHPGWTGEGTGCADRPPCPWLWSLLSSTTSIHSDWSEHMLHWWVLVGIGPLLIPILQMRKLR